MYCKGKFLLMTPWSRGELHAISDVSFVTIARSNRFCIYSFSAHTRLQSGSKSQTWWDTALWPQLEQCYKFSKILVSLLESRKLRRRPGPRPLWRCAGIYGRSATGKFLEDRSGRRRWLQEKRLKLVIYGEPTVKRKSSKFSRKWLLRMVFMLWFFSIQSILLRLLIL